MKTWKHAHGGSLIFSASLLELNAACGGPPDAEVLGVDIALLNELWNRRVEPPRRYAPPLLIQGEFLQIAWERYIDIRAHNRAAIEAHPMFKRITMMEGSSIAPEIIARVKAKAADQQRVLVCLDSHHTHDHVRAELEAYAPLTSVGSYCVVFDTVIEDLPAELFPDRP